MYICFCCIIMQIIHVTNGPQLPDTIRSCKCRTLGSYPQKPSFLINFVEPPDVVSLYIVFLMNIFCLLSV